uniref:Jacalin-type lectin domain-containing protein n=1 Tax=Chenopodium quinoa TaxID=63459 RepID=A0A803MH34_CHEQI
MGLGGKTIEWFTGPGGSQSEIPLSVGEKLTHISGTSGMYYEEVCITTIRIHTTLCPEGYGPYGEVRAANNVTPFSTPLPLDGSIVGFLGSNGEYLNSIGIYNARKMIKEYGPFGNKESSTKWHIELNDGERFPKVFIKHGFIVDGVGFEVSSPNGKTRTQIFGGPGGDTSEVTEAKPFSTPVPLDGTIVGFNGSCGIYLNSIGISEKYKKVDTYGPFGRA